jgi:hypothetical protein
MVQKKTDIYYLRSVPATPVDVVLRHYFKPGRAQFKAVLMGALPAVLTGATAAPLKPVEELKALATKLAEGTASAKDKKRLRLLAAKA